MKKILIIEDDVDIQIALKEKLREAHYEVEAADTSEEGLRAVITGRHDLIILDVFTNSLHAASFLDRLRQQQDEVVRATRVIVFTNLDNDVTRKKVGPFNIDAFMVKSSTSLESIVAKVHEIIGPPEEITNP